MRGASTVLHSTLATGAAVILDRTTKWYALTHKSTFPAIRNETFFFFSSVTNYSATALSLLALVIVSMLFVHALIKKSRTHSALLVIIGGAGSNVFDRIYYGGVVDVIHTIPLLTFNLADIVIMVGLLTYIHAHIHS